MSDWRDDAACRQYDPEIWWPIGESQAAQTKTEFALAVCWNTCPVRATCDRFAEETGQREGIWGGMTESQRTKSRRARDRVRQREARDAERDAAQRSGTALVGGGL